MLRNLVLMALLATLAGCGSGFVAIFSDEGGSTTTAPPTFALSGEAILPLVPPLEKQITINVRNFQLPPRGEGVTVELRALGVVQRFSQVFSAQGRITLEYSAPEISNKVEDRFNTDVPALLAVLVNGVEIAPPVPVLLLRQPTAVVEGRPARVDLSPFGGEVTVRMTSVVYEQPSTPHPIGSAEYTKAFLESNPDMSARHAFGNNVDDQFSSTIRSVAPQVSGALLVTVAMPAVDHPGQVHVVVDSFPSGASNLVSNVYYRPAVRVASPSSGASEGGTPVILFGKAFVPHEFKNKSELLWDRIKVTMHKGGRITQLEDRINRELSGVDRLVFSMPASSDGRPGPASIHVLATVQLIGDNKFGTVETTATEVFTFGDSSPYFGPRGALLRELPVVTEMAPFVNTANAATDAISVTTGALGIPYISVLRGRGNGVFTRFGQPLRAGLVGDQFQRNPIGICIADFVGNRTRSGVILNTGIDGLARHGLVVGTDASNPPISYDENFQLELEKSGRACASGDFNGDGISDLVVLSSPLRNETSSTPVVFVSSGPPTKPTFRRDDFSSYQGTPFDFTAVDVADMDGDGNADLLFASGGVAPRLLIAFGRGTGKFNAAEIVDLDKGQFDLSSLGYTPHKDSRVVGVHAMFGNGRPTVAVVFSGASASAKSPPMVVHFRRGANNRSFATLRTSDLLMFSGVSRLFVDSEAGPLRKGGKTILTVAARGDTSDPIRLFGYDSLGGLQLLRNAVAFGPNPIGNVLAVHTDLVADPGIYRQANGRYGVFLTHQEVIGGRIENRISTFLANPAGTALAAPSASRVVDSKILGVALGRFVDRTSNVTAKDAWLAVPNGLRRVANDGLGELTVSTSTVTTTNLLAETFKTVAFGSTKARAQDIPAWLTQDGRLGVVLPNDPTKVVYAGGATPKDLRDYAPGPLRARVVQPNSMIQCADVNADGWLDLVAMVSLTLPPGQGSESLLLLFPGVANPGAGKFPFSLPTLKKTGDSLTHGAATSFALGDFGTSTTANTLEVAVATPSGTHGNWVRFYHWDVAKQSFEHSFVDGNHPSLPVGNEPYRITAGDYNGDNRTDIAVVSRVDKSLWIYHNGASAAANNNVDVKRFVGAPANPMALPDGMPKRMISQDINGDAIPDVVVLLQSGTSIVSQQIAFYVNPGRLGGAGVRLVSGERTGNIVFSGSEWELRDAAAAVDLGDLNGDGAPDLVIGWSTVGTTDHNLRVLFSNNF